MSLHSLPPFSREHPWWGQWSLPIGHQVRWSLGPLTLWIQHLRHEWRLAWRNEEDVFAYEVAEQSPPEDLIDQPNLQRYCFGQDIETVELKPSLADRPVVSKPEKPLYIASGEDVALYLSFPLWIRIEAGPSVRLLKELPTLRLSDTWFGPSTQEGGLCYASRNFGRVTLTEQLQRPHRILTAVRLSNHAPDPWCIERINVPFPNLSIYQDKAGVLWTEAITLERRALESHFEVVVGRGPPPEAREAQAISPARQVVSKTTLSRAIGTLWSL